MGKREVKRNKQYEENKRKYENRYSNRRQILKEKVSDSINIFSVLIYLTLLIVFLVALPIGISRTDDPWFPLGYDYQQRRYLLGFGSSFYALPSTIVALSILFRQEIAIMKPWKKYLLRSICIVLICVSIGVSAWLAWELFWWVYLGEW